MAHPIDASQQGPFADSSHEESAEEAAARLEREAAVLDAAARPLDRDSASASRGKSLKHVLSSRLSHGIWDRCSAAHSGGSSSEAHMLPPGAPEDGQRNKESMIEPVGCRQGQPERHKRHLTERLSRNGELSSSLSGALPRHTPSGTIVAAGDACVLYVPDGSRTLAGVAIETEQKNDIHCQESSSSPICCPLAYDYFSKWCGTKEASMGPVHWLDMVFSWVGSFVSLVAIALADSYWSPQVHIQLLIPSFGASAVLLFGVPSAPMAQPRNLMGGHVLSALVGILIRLGFSYSRYQLVWLSGPLGMATALVVMQATRTVHPPGGATALIIASAEQLPGWKGFKFLVTVVFGCAIMLAVALISNNCSPRRRYPTFWV